MPARIASGDPGQAATTAANIPPRAPPRGFLGVPAPRLPQGLARSNPQIPPRNMGGVPAPFSPRLKPGGGGTKPPRLYRGGNPASNAYMYRYRRDTESDTKPHSKPSLTSHFWPLIH